MAGRFSPDTRDAITAAFRQRVLDSMGVTLFEHQARYWKASEGWLLTSDPDPSGYPVLIPESRLGPGEAVLDRFEVNGQPVAKVGKLLAPRPGGRARFLVDLGSFKVGKSFGAGLYGTGYAAVPGSRVSLVGLEYDICEPEFNYIVEALLSERGMGLKKSSLVNRPRQGDMFLELDNGTRYEARSWERKDSLKGKEIDLYIYCEAYQLPGIECFTGFSQNLRARRGGAIFATTPDRPWVKELHHLGHGGDEEWECVCGVSSESNPFTYDPRAKERDRSLMTREKFQIHYEGQLGEFVGRVFNYQQGQRQFSAASHPYLFEGGITDREHFRLPTGWEVVSGADTGTYYTGCVVAFSPTGQAFVVDELPNYRYVGGTADRDEDLTIPEWVGRAKRALATVGARAVFWADANSQFKGEFRNYGVTLLPDKSTREQRTEVSREYFQHERILLAPWLSVLPFELENASWPEEASATGKYERVKDRDHTLDCLEHVLVKRARGKIPDSNLLKGSWALGSGLKKKGTQGNVHLGKN